MLHQGSSDRARRLVAGGLVALVLLLPAASVAAAPPAAEAGRLALWLDGLADRLGLSDLAERLGLRAARAGTEGETAPHWDPDGLTAAPPPTDPQADDGGESFPGWDPNG